MRTRNCICGDLHSDVEQSWSTTAAVALFFALIQLLPVGGTSDRKAFLLNRALWNMFILEYEGEDKGPGILPDHPWILWLLI